MTSGGRRTAAGLASLAVLVVAVVVMARTVDFGALSSAWRTVVARPLAVVATLAVYGAAFVARAAAWRRVLPGVPLGHATAALHVTLAGNHLLPFRLGEPLRITSVVRRTGVSVASATASTVTLRAADVGAVVGIAVAAGGRVVLDFAGWAVAAGGVLAVLVTVTGAVWLGRRRRQGDAVHPPGLVVLGLTVASWLLEAVVVWRAAAWVGVDIGVTGAVTVTAVAVAAQVAAIAPGGVGTYEAAASGVMIGLGVQPGVALAIAVTAHALKTGYALVSGAVATLVPTPGMLGRLRLPAVTTTADMPNGEPRADVPTSSTTAANRKGTQPGPGVQTCGSGSGRRRTVPAAESTVVSGESRPVALFLPAHNEGDSVATVVNRAPASVADHPVRVVVVDDGSTDQTAARAAAAGAEVVRLGSNRGLGAAVRQGFQAALAHEPAAVAFCDADGEYAPEELDRLVRPILEGEAHYVIGSRFHGDIRRMLPHRRLGNRLLTLLVSFVARRPISDGQSGYRAFSPRAAADAEIIHDFNYAQVLTLDLLAKGYRYAEVPITYRFREHGRSFVRPISYLRAVIPAMWQQLNSKKDFPEARVSDPGTL